MQLSLHTCSAVSAGKFHCFLVLVHAMITLPNRDMSDDLHKTFPGSHIIEKLQGLLLTIVLAVHKFPGSSLS